MVKSQILEAAHIPRSLASIFGQSSPDLAKEKQASDVNFSEFNAIVNPSATWMMLQVPNGLQPATQLPQTQSQAQILKTANTKKKRPSGSGLCQQHFPFESIGRRRGVTFPRDWMEGELNCCDCHLHTRHKKRVAARADIKFVPSLCSARQGKYKHSLMLAFSTSHGEAEEKLHTSLVRTPLSNSVMSWTREVAMQNTSMPTAWHSPREEMEEEAVMKWKKLSSIKYIFEYGKWGHQCHMNIECRSVQVFNIDEYSKGFCFQYTCGINILWNKGSYLAYIRSSSQTKTSTSSSQGSNSSILGTAKEMMISLCHCLYDAET